MKFKKVACVVAVLAGALLGGATSANGALTPLAVKTSSADEYLPAAQDLWFSWTQAPHAHPLRQNVYVRHGSAAKIKVNPTGTRGQGGGIDGQTLVYYQYKGRRAGDIRKFNLTTHKRSNFPAKVSTRWDEYHPTISGDWVLFNRYFSTTNATKVLLFNMQTSALRTLGSARGRRRHVYSGQVNGDYAVWGRVRPGGQDVYRYRISTKSTTRIPRSVFAQYNPGVAQDGTIYYQRSGDACGASVKLVRRRPGGSPTVLHSFPNKVDGGLVYVDDRADGSLHVFYAQVKCRSNRWDIYKVIDSHTLTISKDGTGSGSVSSDPTGIDCGGNCQAIFHGGTTVTLTATPDPGSVFSSWSDPSCGTNTTCVVTAEDDVSLTATFN
jgi:hypothetical protein